MGLRIPGPPPLNHDLSQEVLFPRSSFSTKLTLNFPCSAPRMSCGIRRLPRRVRHATLMKMAPTIDDYYRQALDQLKAEVQRTPDADVLGTDTEAWVQYLVRR